MHLFNIIVLLGLCLSMQPVAFALLGLYFIGLMIRAALH